MSRERRATIYSLRLTTWQYMKARWSLPGLQLLRKEFGCRSRLITRNSRLVLSSFAMLGGRTSEEWIAQYASSHQHPVNRFCHTFGIPLIVISLLLFVASIFVREILLYAVALFIFGMDTSVRRTHLRRQAPRVLPRLAVPLCRTPLVVGKGPRPGLSMDLHGCHDERGSTIPADIVCPMPCNS